MTANSDNPQTGSPALPTQIGPVRERITDKRRSKRVRIAMPITVCWKRGSANFQEQGATAVVSAHGCMVYLAAQLEKGEQVCVINTATLEEQTCSVVYVGQTDTAKIEVGLEFVNFAPKFWRIQFPPEDWDPAERKLPKALPQTSNSHSR